jgi:hypothetical protein
MKSTVLWALIILNAALLVSFVWRVMPENAAVAQQRGAAAPARAGDYLIIPAEISGGSNGVLVVLDQTNGQLSAAAWDDANRRPDFMGKVDLRRAMQGAAAPARAGRNQ